MSTDALINVVLDQSGSMESTRQAMIDGYNKFKAEQAALPGKTLWSLTLFETGNIEKRYIAEDVHSVPDLDTYTYRPGGGTPLYDAVAESVTAVRGLAKASLPDKVIFVVITDGDENESKEYKGKEGLEKLGKLIEEAKKYDDWQFVFMGADMTRWKTTSASMGVGVRSSGSYVPNTTGTQTMYATISQGTTSYRSGATASVDVSIPASSTATASQNTGVILDVNKAPTRTSGRAKNAK